MYDSYRYIPPVHEILKNSHLQEIVKVHNLNETLIKKFVNIAIEDLRDSLKMNVSIKDRVEAERYIIKKTNEMIEQFFFSKLQRVINGTGTILHTNLGRARLADRAIEKMVEVAKHYSTVEYNLEDGKRGSRHDLVERYLTEITDAEAAMVVNNNAASVYMILKAFAKDQEVIISRGELVEIGGSFRVPSIMEESGAQLKEVGTTNKTHLFDYERAITEQTSMILKVHTSNYKIVGYTSSVERDKLISLADNHHLIYYEDLGSGMLYDLKNHGIGNEPLVKDVINKGADLVSFSGDKLLGGPQVGIIVGKKKWIDYLKQHQLARVLRVDKMTYAALEETLRLTIINTEQSINEIRTLRDILKSQDEIKQDVEQFVSNLPKLNDLIVKPIKLKSNVGGGTLPEVFIQSYGLSLFSKSISSHRMAEYLRKLSPPIITRIEQDQVFIDFRTIDLEDVQILQDKLIALNQQLK